jgi:hypothetical protein
MRRLLSLALGLLPVLSLADDLLGTKSDPISAPSSGSTGGLGLAPMLQMLVALGIVLILLKVLLPKLLTKFNKKLVTKFDGGIVIEESASFAGGTLYVVKARKKTLLLSVAATGVVCLSDLTEPDPLAEAQTFQEMVDTAVIEVDETEETSDPRFALERLRRFTG